MTFKKPPEGLRPWMVEINLE